MQIQGQYVESGSQSYSSAAAEENRQLKTGPGKMFSVILTNFNAAARYVYIFDGVGPTGALLAPPIPLTAGGTAGSLVAVFLPFAMTFQTGLYVAASSTGAMFTAAGAADLRMLAVYK